MTGWRKRQVMDMAREAGMVYREFEDEFANANTDGVDLKTIEAFAELVRADERTWVGLIRGVRVEGDSVVVTVKGGNDAARELCSELVNEMGVRNGD